MRIFGIVVSLLGFWPVVSDAACRKEPVPEESSPDGAIYAGSFGDWSIFTNKDGDQCWAATKPMSEDISGGHVTSEFCRNDAYLMINNVPQDNIFDQVSYFSGFAFNENIVLEMNLGGTSFTMPIMDGQFAWTKSSSDDTKFIDKLAMIDEFTIKSVSKTGFVVLDLFGASGLRDALQAAKLACSGVITPMHVQENDANKNNITLASTYLIQSKRD